MIRNITPSDLVTYNVVKAVIVNDGQILIVLSDKYWTLPGGKKDQADEIWDETLAREIDEETPGLRFECVNMMYYQKLEWRNIVLFGMLKQPYTRDTKTDVIIGHEISDSKWADINEVKKTLIYWRGFFNSADVKEQLISMGVRYVG